MPYQNNNDRYLEFHREQLYIQPPRYGSGSFVAPFIIFVINSIIAAILSIFAILLFSEASSPDDEEFAVGLVFLLISGVFSIISMVAYLILIYRCWNVIQDGYAQTTPGKAIGYLFIPIFNIYWVFIAIYGLSNDLNSYIKRYRLNLYSCNNNLVLVSLILGFIPYISSINTILFPFALYSIMRTARDIQQCKMRQIRY